MIVQIVNTGVTFMLYLMRGPRMEELYDAKARGLLLAPGESIVEDVSCIVEDRYEVDYLIDVSGRIEPRTSIIAPRPMQIATNHAMLYADRIELYHHDRLNITWPVKFFFISGAYYVKDPLKH
jgi:hypothetical protein